MAAISYGKCLFKGSCPLNCQVFVQHEDSILPSSQCLACDHLAAFHEQPKHQTTAEVSIDQPASTSSVSTCPSKNDKGLKGTFGKVKSFSQWLKEKKSKEKTTKKKKGKEKSAQNVTITTGLMKHDSSSSSLKKVWGKKLPITVPSDATYSVILDKAVAKWKAFNSFLMEANKEYLLLYEDGKQALYLPGDQQEDFTLSRYKEELGRDYRRICLFICIEDDYDEVLFHESSEEEEEETKNTTIRKTKVCTLCMLMYFMYMYVQGGGGGEEHYMG